MRRYVSCYVEPEPSPVSFVELLKTMVSALWREISRDRILSDQEIPEFWRASLRQVPKSSHAASGERQQP